MLTKLKEQVQLWLVGEARIAHSLGLTPNKVSGVGIIFALLSTISYWQWKVQPTLFLILAPLFLLVSGFCDALDGVLARHFSATSTFGGFLDSLLDRYTDAMVFAGIILGGLSQISWGLLALTGSLLVSYCRARAEAAGVKMETVGLMERAERIIIIIIASFLTLAWNEALQWGIVLLAVLTNLTVLQRAIYFRKASQKEPKIGVV
ncbi:MAG: CDP-alcohol phosphatidyltransferase family protein [Candidatus Bathyarchaeota archaeon]|nr:MAG: CDP-alcohol phosphatidyltransferase family protein [Candidatus Bathyarchaeota archaeon]